MDEEVEAAAPPADRLSFGGASAVATCAPELACRKLDSTGHFRRLSFRRESAGHLQDQRAWHSQAGAAWIDRCAAGSEEPQVLCTASGRDASGSQAAAPPLAYLSCPCCRRIESLF